jgi:Glycosyltransferases involved in cell wall biogenesis
VISVIIPALNEEDVIEYCLQSLENQNYKNFEIIVVDGGSKDRTVEIAEKYARVIKQKSKTIGGARKEGTLAAKGDILAFTDADTIFDPNWLSSIEKSMKKFNAATGPVYFYENTFNASVLEFWRKSYAPQRLVGFYRIIGSNMAIRKDTYKNRWT